tara:strand:+ start:99 stop:1142 length:1044 start_codon:yes stop_codon:yes gene_type:complete
MAYISFKPQDHFNAKLYTGNSSVRTLTGVGFQPDWVWIKDRNNARDHMLFDAVRGATKDIRTNATDVESTIADTLTAFTSDGISLGADSTAASALVNGNSNSYVSWNWKANGQGSANNDGSTNTTYTSANTTAGISIVKWTPSGSVETVGHGLGVVPKMIITKNLGASQNWITYHHSIGNTKYILLDSTNGTATDSTAWNNTTPTSSVFTVGAQFGGNPYVAYCFAEKKGFSKIGLYKGNGNASGTFVYTGFKPAVIIFKQSSANGEKWYIYDNKRNTFNITNSVLFPNSSLVESAATTGAPIDMLSNGFKLRGTDAAGNSEGASYIYIAFADEPFVASNGDPATAR